MWHPGALFPLEPLACSCHPEPIPALSPCRRSRWSIDAPDGVHPPPLDRYTVLPCGRACGRPIPTVQGRPRGLHAQDLCSEGRQIGATGGKRPGATRLMVGSWWAHGGGCPASTAQLLCRAMCRSLSKLIVARIIGPVA